MIDTSSLFGQYCILLACKLDVQLEGFRSTPYKDGAGVWTIGNGTTILPDGTPVTEKTPHINEITAALYLNKNILKVADRIFPVLPAHLYTGRVVAVLSFAYNVGIEGFLSSTILEYINNADFEAAAAEFDKWIYITDPNTKQKIVSTGLKNRRATEKAWFLGQQTTISI